MLQPGRHGNSGDYRYGFNGKETDDEVKGEGLQIDYGFRVYDPRLGKFLSEDPLTASFPWFTPYQFAGNTPIQSVDLDGKEVYDYRLDLNDKGQAVGHCFVGINTRGILGWSVWNNFNVQVPAIDVYIEGNYFGRYSFNTGGQGGFKTLNKFIEDEEFRLDYIKNTNTYEENMEEFSENIGDQFTAGFLTAFLMKNPSTPAPKPKVSSKKKVEAKSEAHVKATTEQHLLKSATKLRQCLRIVVKRY